tara:strand:- start:4 stop:276 length:273 start_codon:yes stop_codon:yes gene_type:complete
VGCNCKKKSTENRTSSVEVNFTKEELVEAVSLLDTNRKFTIEQITVFYDLFNRIYQKKETNINCGDCQRRVSRGLRYRLDEINGKRKTKR